jgi:NAD(P)-dependent dehydrogenase (short-subunit alcohol dehydrogenase family)
VDTIDGATAVVTGAASGIGWQLTRQLLGEGARVVMADVEPDALEEAAAEARTLGEVLAVRVDVRDGASVDALAAQATAAFGVATLVFPNAGISVSGAIWDMTLDDWNWVLGVNLWGAIHTMRAFVPPLIASGLPGHVCFTGSLAGYLNQPGFGAYNTSKHGVTAIAETLAGDLREAGLPIGVTVVAPWFVNTKLAQSGRNRPRDLAEATPPGDLIRSIGARLAPMRSSAQDAEHIASLAIDAVKSNRFGVFPFEPSVPAVRERIDAVLDGRLTGFFSPN